MSARVDADGGSHHGSFDPCRLHLQEHLEDLGHLIANLKGRSAYRAAGARRGGGPDNARGAKRGLAAQLSLGSRNAVGVGACRRGSPLLPGPGPAGDVILDDVRHSRRAHKFQIYFPAACAPSSGLMPWTNWCPSVRSPSGASRGSEPEDPRARRDLAGGRRSDAGGVPSPGAGAGGRVRVLRSVAGAEDPDRRDVPADQQPPVGVVPEPMGPRALVLPPAPPGGATGGGGDGGSGARRRDGGGTDAGGGGGRESGACVGDGAASGSRGGTDAGSGRGGRNSAALVPVAGTTGNPVLVNRRGQGEDGDAHEAGWAGAQAARGSSSDYKHLGLQRPKTGGRVAPGRLTQAGRLGVIPGLPVLAGNSAQTSSYFVLTRSSWLGMAVAVGLPGHSFLPVAETPKGGTAGQRRRHHLHESVLQRAVREAALSSGVPKRVMPSIRHSFATALMEGRLDTGRSKNSWGTPMLATTMIYTPRSKPWRPGVRRPLDAIF